MPSNQNLVSSETVQLVVINHADRLHERITDRRPNKSKPSPEQILAHCLSFQVGSRQILQGLDLVPDRFIFDKPPNI